MKKLLTLLTLSVSLSAMAQSFIIESTGSFGIVRPIDTNGFIYDPSKLSPPDKLATVALGSIIPMGKGKNWFITSDRQITTVAQNGTLFRPTYLPNTPQVPKKLKASGGSWFVSENDELGVVGRNGLAYIYKDIELIKKGKIIISGGNWLVIEKDRVLQLVTLDLDKAILNVPFTPEILASLKLDPKTIKTAGGNYFVTENGTLFTVNTAGLLTNQSILGTIQVKTKGGNYFVEADKVINGVTTLGLIRTVLSNGIVYVPNYVPNGFAGIVRTGANYGWGVQGLLHIMTESFTPAQMASVDPATVDFIHRNLIKTPMNDFQVDSRMVLP